MLVEIPFEEAARVVAEDVAAMMRGRLSPIDDGDQFSLGGPYREGALRSDDRDELQRHFESVNVAQAVPWEWTGVDDIERDEDDNHVGGFVGYGVSRKQLFLRGVTYVTRSAEDED